MQALFDVQGQTAVITGGSGGLGSVMAVGLAQAGVKVAVVGLHEAKVEAVAAAIRAQGDLAIGLACDVLDRASLQRVLEQVAIIHRQQHRQHKAFSSWTEQPSRAFLR